MKVKYFTPKEANLRLPYVRGVVQDILQKGRNLQSLVLVPQKITEIQEQQGMVQEQIYALMEELEELGCYFKDWNFEIGLVDFPAIINGKQVLLCWRSDETEVRWYHGYEDGYAGRQPIPEELL